MVRDPFRDPWVDTYFLPTLRTGVPRVSDLPSGSHVLIWLFSYGINVQRHNKLMSPTNYRGSEPP